MKCPKCGVDDDKVIDSRPNENCTVIRRRRECRQCRYRFSTFEAYELAENVSLVVIKKNNTMEIFDKNKIINGLIRACYKRPVTSEKINELADEVESELRATLRSEFSSTEIGTVVMRKLKELDEVSYVRFASVYREFKDVETFMQELNDLKSEKDSLT